MMNRKIISEACTENSPLKVFGSTNCSPGAASSARISIASRPPTKKKKNVVHDVLDADDLVVGVDPEVVLPVVAPWPEWSSGIVGAPDAQRNQ